MKDMMKTVGKSYKTENKYTKFLRMWPNIPSAKIFLAFIFILCRKLKHTYLINDAVTFDKLHNL